MFLKLTFCAFGVTLIGLTACRQDSTPELAQGGYRLLSAQLSQSGKLNELNCAGQLLLVLKKTELGFEISSQGETQCDAAQPASFVERLGGSCDKQPIQFTRTARSETFVSEGSSFDCQTSASQMVRWTVQPVSQTSIRLIRSVAGDSNLRSEFFFEYFANAL